MLIEANGANGATVREYIWFDDMPLAIVANVDTASPQLLHVHADHLDRPIMLTNSSKANVWEAVYRPFGEVHAITGTATQNLRFPGQFFLFETGLAHNWHRTYDATIGRYLQADPLGFVDGPSVYSYVRGSPIALVDPLGQRSGSISRRPIWQPSPQSVPNICQQFPAVCGGWIPVAVEVVRICQGVIYEMVVGGGPRRGDPCKRLRDELRDHEKNWLITSKTLTVQITKVTWVRGATKQSSKVAYEGSKGRSIISGVSWRYARRKMGAKPVTDISIAELRIAIDKMLDHLVEKGITAVPIEKNLYWSVDGERRFDLSEPPKDLVVGSIIDEYEFISRLLKSEREPLVTDLEKVAILLQYIGETVSMALARQGG